MKDRLGCLPVIIVLIINLSIGGIATNYILALFGEDIPWFGDAVIGLFLGEFTIPLAVIGWLLSLFGIF